VQGSIGGIDEVDLDKKIERKKREIVFI